MSKFTQSSRMHGFTIVELLIVVVVIAILAAITIVSYNGIIIKSHQSKLIAEVSSAGKVMSTDNTLIGSYPLSIGAANGGKGIQASDSLAFNFYSSATTFCITAISSKAGVDSYYVSHTSLTPTKGMCSEDVGVAVSTLAGNGTAGFADGTGSAAVLFSPAGLVANSTGTLYFADGATSRIRAVTTAGVVTTLAGSGASSYAEGTGTGALFNWPQALTIGSGGVLYIADSNNSRVRQLTTAGVSSLIAGSTQGYAEGTGAAAQFNVPRGITYDASTNRIYLADSQSNLIRQVTPSGVVTTFAGQASGGFANGTGAAAQFNYPQGLASDASGNVYVADTLNHRIRKITPAGVVDSVAGGSAGFNDANGASAQFSSPMALAVDANGNIYVADSGNNRIRKITPSGDVTTIAGSGVAGFNDASGTSAQFNSPRGIALGSDGKLYVTDTNNHRIRVLSI